VVNVIDKLKAEGACRLCDRSSKGVGGRELTRHRLVPGRFGGRYEYANVIPLCNTCHIAVEGESPVDRRMLRPKLWPIEIAHVLEHMGEEWFEAMYPRPSGPAITFREADALAPYELPPRKPWQPKHTWTVGDRLRAKGIQLATEQSR